MTWKKIQANSKLIVYVANIPNLLAKSAKVNQEL